MTLIFPSLGEPLKKAQEVNIQESPELQVITKIPLPSPLARVQTIESPGGKEGCQYTITRGVRKGMKCGKSTKTEYCHTHRLKEIDRTSSSLTSPSVIASSPISSKEEKEDKDEGIRGEYCWTEGECNDCKIFARGNKSEGERGTFCHDHCAYCKQFRKLDELAKRKEATVKHREKNKRQKGGKEIKRGYTGRFLTVMLPNEIDGDDAREVYRIMIEKISKSKMFMSCGHYGVIELTLNGYPHMHVIVNISKERNKAINWVRSKLLQFLYSSMKESNIEKVYVDEIREREKEGNKAVINFKVVDNVEKCIEYMEKDVRGSEYFGRIEDILE